MVAEARSGSAEKLGLRSGQVVAEFGWDEDVDDALRAGIEDVIGGEMLDEDTDEVVDVVVFWWRDGDGDLVDALMDVIGPLADDGYVWVLTPKTGIPGHVEPSEIAQSAPSAGFTQTSSTPLGGWVGLRLVQPKARPGKRS